MGGRKGDFPGKERGSRAKGAFSARTCRSGSFSEEKEMAEQKAFSMPGWLPLPS
jgi:hypothetical protein